MLLLKAISLLCILALAISLVEASVPILWGIQPKNTTCSGAGVYYRKICDGNVVCTYRNTGPCCGGCDSTWCSVCPSGTVCSGKGCTALYSIIVGVVFGAIFLFIIIGFILRTFFRYRNATSATKTIVMQMQETNTAPPAVYEEEATVVVVPPPQQPYAPNTYIVQDNPPVYVAQNDYGAGQGQVYYSTGGVHDTY